MHKWSKIHDRQNEQIMLCSSIAIIVIIFKHYVLNKNSWLTVPFLAPFRQFCPGEDWIGWIRNTWWSRWESRTNDSNISRLLPLTPWKGRWFCNKVSSHLSTDQFCWWMATLLGWWNDPFTQVTGSDLQLHGIKRSNWITWYRDVFPVRVSVVCFVNETWSFRWDNLR